MRSRDGGEQTGELIEQQRSGLGAAYLGKRRSARPVNRGHFPRVAPTAAVPGRFGSLAVSTRPLLLDQTIILTGDVRASPFQAQCGTRDDRLGMLAAWSKRERRSAGRPRA